MTIIRYEDDITDLFLLRFAADEAAEEGDELSIPFPHRDLPRGFVEARILEEIVSLRAL